MTNYGFNQQLQTPHTYGFGGGYYPYELPYDNQRAATISALPAAAAAVTQSGGMGGAFQAGQVPMQMGAMGGTFQAAQAATPPQMPSGAITPGGGMATTLPAIEESYVENILRLNRGKLATFYMTYENNREWNAKIFKGIIEAAGRDHIIISDPATGTRFLLLMLNLDYVTFDEPIAYEYPFQGQVVTQSTPVGG
ncbi:spore coat protein GerQ [Paenibacillus nanensis]|nr:spore coat protein GerQ [Paenibacillus nanensis]